MQFFYRYFVFTFFPRFCNLRKKLDLLQKIECRRFMRLHLNENEIFSAYAAIFHLAFLLCRRGTAAAIEFGVRIFTMTKHINNESNL